MKRKLPPIYETREELQRYLKAERDAQKHQRLQALYLLSTGQAKTRAAAAEALAVHRHSVGAWLAAYEQGGLPAALRIKKPPGKRPFATPEVIEALQARLREPRGFASYGEIQAYLAQEHQVSMAYSSVHGLSHATGCAPSRNPHAPRIPKKARSSSGVYRRAADSAGHRGCPRSCPGIP